MDFDRYGYGSVVSVYDELAAFYSRGLIGETKRRSLESLKPGDRVLFPGVGRGDEAIEAVRLGAVVTAVDVSTSMLSRLRYDLDAQKLDAELIEGDVFEHRSGVLYDIVIANYFLNLYEASRAGAMIQALARLLEPRGRLVISDFARPSGGVFGRLVSELYYRPINWIAWLLGLCAMHPILDYADLLDPREFRIVSQTRLPVFSGANPGYVSIIAERIAD